jgi:cilia- and flagella-associated protein 65
VFTFLLLLLLLLLYIPTKTVQYYPKAARAFTCDNFDIVTPGGNTVRINCRALGIGPTVVLAKKEGPKADPDSDDENEIQKPVDRPTSLSFGDVKIGNVVSRVIYLNNSSPIPVSFQFVVEDKGTFQFDRTYGVIPPNLQSHVVIRFDPEVSGNFCRRIFCLIKDQMPVAIDCVGTAYADLSKRPAPLSLRQLDAHRRRQDEGLGVLSPAELVDMLNSCERPDLFDLNQVNELSCGGSKTRLTRSGEATEAAIAPMHTFFKEQCGVGNEITMNVTSLDFGGCSRHRPAEQKRITVRNNTHGKVTCMWRIPLSDDDDDELDFEVVPNSADIPPGETYTFRVVFRPSQDDFYYNQEVEAFVYFKSNRNFRLVNDDTLVPPWCLTCRVFGHTFGSSNEQFIPTMKCSK